MIDVLICQMLDLFATKKAFVNLIYLVGTTIFIVLSYNTANHLAIIPVVIPSISDRNGSITVLSRFEERSAHLRSVCRYPTMPSKQMFTNQIHRSQLLGHLGFVLRSHSLFYCSVPKVATRTFLLFLTYLHIRDEILPNVTSSHPTVSAQYNVDYLRSMLHLSNQNESVLLTFLSRLQSHNQINASQLDLWLMYQERALPSVRLRTLIDPSILFSPSFQRVIFVRHPLERLASAYIDKIATLKNPTFSLYDDLRRAMCRKHASAYLQKTELRFYNYRSASRYPVHEPCATKIPTFEHFIDYLSSDASQNDVHWQPYSSLCRVCQFKYNFIGKYETIKEDLAFLLTRLGLDPKEWNRNNPYSTGRTTRSYQSMYSNLSDRILCFLKYFYREDLKYFNYQLEDYLPESRPLQCSSYRYSYFPRSN